MHQDIAITLVLSRQSSSERLSAHTAFTQVRFLKRNGQIITAELTRGRAGIITPAAAPRQQAVKKRCDPPEKIRKNCQHRAGSQKHGSANPVYHYVMTIIPPALKIPCACSIYFPSPVSPVHIILCSLKPRCLLRRYNYKISVSLDLYIDNVNIAIIINTSFLGIIPNI